jgi:hypothetical protein
MQDPMRLNFQPDIWADYDPEKVKQGLQSSAGALAGVDHEALRKDIKSQRQQESHSLPSWHVPRCNDFSNYLHKYAIIP